jgi:hypothetical protein
MKKATAATVVALCALFAATGARAVATPPFTAVMTGLDNGRGLAWAPEGGLYVAEAGSGGTTPCFVTGAWSELRRNHRRGHTTLARDAATRRHRLPFLLEGAPGWQQPAGQQSVPRSDATRRNDRGRRLR